MSVTAASVPSVIGSARSSAHFDNVTCFDEYPPAMTDELDAVDIPSRDEGKREDYQHTANDEERQPVETSQAHRRTFYEDDPTVYMNVSEISRRLEYETIDRRPYPPMPDVNDEPIRVLLSGWKEFKTPGGRSYYFHPESGLCQWKPPRTTHPSSAMSASVCIPRSHASRESPATTMSEVFVEMPLRDCHASEEAVTKILPLQSSDDAQHYSKPLQTGPADTCRPYHHNYGYSSDSTHNAQATMTNSVDSGIGRSSISCKNVGFGLPKVTYDTVPFTSENPNYSPESYANASSAASRPTPPSGYALMMPNNHFSATPIRQGPLEKCKLSNNGVKLKKKEWVNSSYAYLYSGHLLFYKDQKSAEKSGKHYPTPTDVCDLRGAKLSYADKQKQDKRRKHVISLMLACDTEYLFCCSGSESEINGWFHALRQTVSTLPAAQAYPCVVDSDSLSRRPSLSGKQASESSSAQFAKKSSLRQSVKARLKSGSRDNIDNASVTGADGTPTRESIIERLLRFFRSRPSVESLRERGIYRPEPVFGSTLAAICQHDRSLVPRFIVEVTRLIESKGLDVDGLYRVSGNLSAVQRIRCQIDQDRYEALEAEEDVHVLTGALKLFFRELAEPIFPKDLNKEFMGAIREPNSRQRFRAIDELLQKLPEVNKETLRVLFSHLERVAVHSGKNRMQVHNLAIMFGPALFCTDDRPNVKKAPAAGTDKNAKNKKKQADKKNVNESSPPPAEPSQNLAYKMVIYGQIVEYILTECQRFAIFQ